MIFVLLPICVLYMMLAPFAFIACMFANRTRSALGILVGYMVLLAIVHWGAL